MAVRWLFPVFFELTFFLAACLAVDHAYNVKPKDSKAHFAAQIFNKKLFETIDSAVNQVLSHTHHPYNLFAIAEEFGAAHNLTADNAQCLEDLSRWKTAFSSGETWALKMADSTSKFIVGILYGDSGDLGDFDECVEATPGTLGSDDDFTGLYALPTLTVQTRTDSSSKTVLTSTHRKGSNVKATSNTSDEWTDEVSLRFALCAPSTCSAQFLQTALNTEVLPVINNFTEIVGIRLSLSLTQEYTSLHSGYRQPDSLDWCIVSLCIFLGAMVIIATFIDLLLGTERLKRGEGWGSRIVVAFSARINGKKLMTVGPSGTETMSCIHGIRSLSMLWIVQAHRWIFETTFVPYTNLTVVFDYIFGNYWFFALVVDAIFSVDTYLLVSGIVNTYVFLKTVKKTNSFNVLQFYIHRYIRMAPSFMCVLAIAATWMSLVGNGPLWYYVNEQTQSCRRAWWTHLLFVGNYVHPENPCLVLWYPNLDMQLYWVSPLVLVPLWKRPRLGVLWLLLLIIASCALPLGISLSNNYRFLIPDFADNDNTPLWEKMYLGTHMRATPYFVGLLTGYLLYLIKVEKRSFKLNVLQTLFLWLLGTAMCLAVLLAACPLYNTEDVGYSKLASGFYIGLARLGWAMGLAWVIVACVTGHGGPVNTLLSWTPFAIIGRLTYGIYLTHFLAVLVDRGLDRSADFFNAFKLTHRTIADFIIGTIFAIVLSLTIESPILLLEKWFWEPRKPRDLRSK